MLHRGKGRRNSLFARINRPRRGARVRGKRFRSRWTLVYLVLFAILLTAQVKNPDQGDSFFSKALLTITGPPVAIAGWASDFFSSIAGEWTRVRFLYDSQDQLEKEVQQLKEKNALLVAQESENKRLKELLNLVQSNPRLQGATAARVTSMMLSPFTQTATLNLGSSKGLSAPSPVVTPHGVAGRLLSTGLFSSKVLLMTDPRFGMGVRFQRTREPALLTTLGDGTIEIRGMESGADLQIGDQVVSSGLDGIFPPDLPVGEIFSIEPVAGENDRILLRPFSQPHLLEEVLILPPVPSPGPGTDI